MLGREKLIGQYFFLDLIDLKHVPTICHVLLVIKQRWSLEQNFISHLILYSTHIPQITPTAVYLVLYSGIYLQNCKGTGNKIVLFMTVSFSIKFGIFFTFW